jgi:8-oxo-dGTP pyrophosphatase MutT (NUDIX family)
MKTIDMLNIPERQSAFVISTRNPYVYLSKKHKKWHLVGGKSEEGERPLETIVREISEELGVRYCSGNFVEFARRQHFYHDGELWHEYFFINYEEDFPIDCKDGLTRLMLTPKLDIAELKHMTGAALYALIEFVEFAVADSHMWDKYSNDWANALLYGDWKL